MHSMDDYIIIIFLLKYEFIELIKIHLIPFDQKNPKEVRLME